MLFICGIDIGDRGDFPLRTRRALLDADVVVAEHISEFNSIRDYFNLNIDPEVIEFNGGISKSKETVARIIELAKDKNVALICNSGMPSIFDPGTDIVNAANHNDIRYVVIPGPTSIITALVSSGFDTYSFSFEGEVGLSSSDRVKKFQKIIDSIEERKTVIFLELLEDNLQHTLLDMLDVFGPNSEVAVCMNLTRSDETIFVGKIDAAYGKMKELTANKTIKDISNYITYVCNIVK